MKDASPPEAPWHALDVEAAFRRLSSGPGGLSAAEAARRQALSGPNALPPPRRPSPLTRFLLQFHNILIYILLASAALTARLGHGIDTGVILGVVFINAVIGFLQEGKAERALEAIRATLSLRASALRDGRRAGLAARDLVPGDVILLRAGDKVPADLRLFEASDLRIDESLLTGESEGVEKGVDPAPPGAQTGDRAGMAFSGTLVIFGQGRGLVVATGKDTEIGRIGTLLDETQAVETPLLRDMRRFGRMLTLWVLGGAALILALGVLRGNPLHDMLLAAVGIAVAAIPEGLPAVLTITLALGVQRMAARSAIIRRLPAVEALGSVTVICTDKTGTLTRNEMTVTRLATANGRYEVTGAGFSTRGDFFRGGARVSPEAEPGLAALLLAGALCNDAHLSPEDDAVIEGAPTEGALLVAARKAGLDPAAIQAAQPRADVVPFASERRYMATLHRGPDGEVAYLKGAPEEVLALCRTLRRDGGDVPLDDGEWIRAAHELADRGQRVLAAAVATGGRDATLPALLAARSFTLLGFFGLMDPPREEAVRAVAACRGAGIRVIMITGDHAGTALRIAADLGIGGNGLAATGAELEAMDDAALHEVVRDTDVFARASPAHKLRLVEALQRRGEVVAMTGDGVNDAPALKRADVGVAMGRKGTEAAKEASEMVLADDNFATIAHAVEEGRAIYDNLRKALAFILPTNAAEGMVVATAIALGLPLPITPAQILWVNMITAVTLSLALAFEPPEADVMRRPPRPADQSLLSGFLAWRVAFVSLLFLVGTFGQFFWEEAHGSSQAVCRTVAVDSLVLLEVAYLYNTRFLFRSALSLSAFRGNPAAPWAVALVLFFQLLFTYAPPMQALFGTASVGPEAWARMAAGAAAGFFLMEAEKRYFRGRADAA